MTRKTRMLAATAATLALTGLGASWKEKPGMYAVFETSHGTIVAELYPKMAPQTVDNFVGLAEGTKEYTDPNLGQKVKRHFYDGLKFHRIIPGFMMQGGDPLGSGTGGPGYNIPDEFSSELMFDVPGRLAMARTPRPNSAGSQFFITQAPYPSLNKQYAIFGQVVDGQSVVDTICSTIGTPGGAPRETVIMKKVTIERIKGAGGAPAAKKEAPPAKP
jgi:peptidyl-prolyl cis-trans isomerase A (cyclophilin A)